MESQERELEQTRILLRESEGARDDLKDSLKESAERIRLDGEKAKETQKTLIEENKTLSSENMNLSSKLLDCEQKNASLNEYINELLVEKRKLESEVTAFKQHEKDYTKFERAFIELQKDKTKLEATCKIVFIG